MRIVEEVFRRSGHGRVKQHSGGNRRHCQRINAEDAPDIEIQRVRLPFQRPHQHQHRQNEKYHHAHDAEIKQWGTARPSGCPAPAAYVPQPLKSPPPNAQNRDLANRALRMRTFLLTSASCAGRVSIVSRYTRPLVSLERKPTPPFEPPAAIASSAPSSG